MRSTVLLEIAFHSSKHFQSVQPRTHSPPTTEISPRHRSTLRSPLLKSTASGETHDERIWRSLVMFDELKLRGTRRYSRFASAHSIPPSYVDLHLS